MKNRCGTYLIMLVFLGVSLRGTAQPLMGAASEIRSGKQLIAEYLAIRETLWRLHPPLSGSHPVTTVTSGQSWYEQAWGKWLASPGWFSSFQGPTARLSPRIQGILWSEQDPRPVRIWEHPGKQELYLGRIDENGQTEIFARWPAPEWQPQAGESPQDFYAREVGTRRIAWTFASPHAPTASVLQASPFQGFAMMMMSSPTFSVTWTNVQDLQALGAHVDLSAATEPGPFAVWKNTVGITTGAGNGWDDLSGDWRPIAWTRDRPSETEWQGTVDGSADGQLYLRASLGLIDSDTDGLDDGFEYWYFGDLDELPSGDFDMDGRSNLEEFSQNSNPAVADSDVDGRKDGEETQLGTDPNWPDHPDTGLTVQGTLLP